MFNNNDDSSSGTTGILGKFRERINKIRKERMLRKQKFKEEQDEFIKEKIKEIREKKYPQKITPPNRKVIKKTNHKKGIFIDKKDNIKTEEVKTDNPNYKNQDNNQEKKISINPEREQTQNNGKGLNNKQINITEKNTNLEKDKKEKPTNIISIPKEEEKQEIKSNVNNNNVINNKENQDTKKTLSSTPTENNNKIETTKESISNDKTSKEKNNLKKKIIKKFKGNFLKKLSELEVLESQLYILNDKTNTELDLNKIKDLKKEISSVIKKINEIIKEYNIYNSSYDFYDTIDLSDNLLIDDLINYKNLIDNYKEQKEMTKEYKLLDEFKRLYQKLDEIKSMSEEVIDNNKAKLDYLEEKKKNKDETNQDIKELDGVMSKCNKEINNQNEYLKELMSKVNNIDKKEITRLKFMSISNLISSSLIFLSSMSITKKMSLPQKIFINTLATANLLVNVYRSLVPDAVTEVRYTAINYDREITNKMNDIDYTSQLVSETLSTISNIKEQFLIQYNSSLPGFNETLNKITTIEESIIKNQYKIDIIKNNLSKSRRQNEEKMLKLEKLNNNN